MRLCRLPVCGRGDGDRNLGVDSDHRRRGVGRALLAYVSREHPGGLYLEVRESNEGALSFYRALGFTSFATRANYYRDTGEAAVLLKREAPGSGADEGSRPNRYVE